MTLPQILSGLSDIASDYDGLICDVWGVLHNGHRAHDGAVEALRRFRAGHGPVMLLSNAPRPAVDLEQQFRHLGVPADCYDAIVTSGMAASADLARRADAGLRRIFHLGPARDLNLLSGIAVERTDLAEAEIVLCTGLFEDEVETPDDYTPMLAELRARDLVLLCANPDIVVQRGGKLVFCAGALARAYETIGGAVVYYGKPHRPVYDAVLAAAPRAFARPLAIGDGIATDIKGANGMGIDALFIADGIHGEEIEAVTSEALATLFAKSGVHAGAAMGALVW